LNLTLAAGWVCNTRQGLPFWPQHCPRARYPPPKDGQNPAPAESLSIVPRELLTAAFKEEKLNMDPSGLMVAKPSNSWRKTTTTTTKTTTTKAGQSTVTQSQVSPGTRPSIRCRTDPLARLDSNSTAGYRTARCGHPVPATTSNPFDEERTLDEHHILLISTA
jgi:hypothetical protein